MRFYFLLFGYFKIIFITVAIIYSHNNNGDDDDVFGEILPVPASDDESQESDEAQYPSFSTGAEEMDYHSNSSTIAETRYEGITY